MNAVEFNRDFQAIVAQVVKGARENCILSELRQNVAVYALADTVPLAAHNCYRGTAVSICDDLQGHRNGYVSAPLTVRQANRVLKTALAAEKTVDFSEFETTPMPRTMNTETKMGTNQFHVMAYVGARGWRSHSGPMLYKDAHETAAALRADDYLGVVVWADDVNDRGEVCNAETLADLNTFIGKSPESDDAPQFLGVIRSMRPVRP